MLEVLNKEELDEIHSTSLELLETKGLKVQGTKALAFFTQSGAIACGSNLDSNIVKLPQHLVRDSIKKAPGSILVGGVQKQEDLQIRPGTLNTRPGSGYTYLVDCRTKAYREATKKDAEDAVKVINKLRNTTMCSTLLEPTDVLRGTNDIYAVKIALANTSKHIVCSPLTPRTFAYIFRMASTVRADEKDLRRRPPISSLVSPTSPLQITRDASEIAIECAQKRVPVVVAPTPMCGATGPVTMAGSLIQQNMEFLALATLIQIVSPGSPVLYAPRCCPMDMRSGVPSLGSIEFGILTAAAVQISHYYGIPVDAHGPTTNSKLGDVQAGFEKGLNGIYPTLAGAEVISGSGSMEFCGTSSLTQLLIDDEYYSMLFRAVDGIKVDDSRIAKDIIHKIGYGGDYLREKHTREFYRQEYRLSEAFDFKTRASWERDGSRGALDRCEAEINRILREPSPQFLERDVELKLEQILAEARNEFLEKGS